MIGGLEGLNSEDREGSIRPGALAFLDSDHSLIAESVKLAESNDSSFVVPNGLLLRMY